MRSMFLALVLSLLSVACATATRPTVVVESVGTLAPSYNSIAVAPVAKSTDLGVSYQAVSADDDVPVSVPETTDETPEVAPKVAHGF